MEGAYGIKKLNDYLTELNGRLSEPDPIEQAKQKRMIKNNVLALHHKLEAIRIQLSDDN